MLHEEYMRGPASLALHNSLFVSLFASIQTTGPPLTHVSLAAMFDLIGIEEDYSFKSPALVTLIKT